MLPAHPLLLARNLILMLLSTIRLALHGFLGPCIEARSPLFKPEGHTLPTSRSISRVPQHSAVLFMWAASLLMTLLSGLRRVHQAFCNACSVSNTKCQPNDPSADAHALPHPPARPSFLWWQKYSSAASLGVVTCSSPWEDADAAASNDANIIAAFLENLHATDHVAVHLTQAHYSAASASLSSAMQAPLASCNTAPSNLCKQGALSPLLQQEDSLTAAPMLLEHIQTAHVAASRAQHCADVATCAISLAANPIVANEPAFPSATLAAVDNPAVTTLSSALPATSEDKEKASKASPTPPADKTVAVAAASDIKVIAYNGEATSAVKSAAPHPSAVYNLPAVFQSPADKDDAAAAFAAFSDARGAAITPTKSEILAAADKGSEGNPQRLTAFIANGKASPQPPASGGAKVRAPYHAPLHASCSNTLTVRTAVNCNAAIGIPHAPRGNEPIAAGLYQSAAIAADHPSANSAANKNAPAVFAKVNVAALVGAANHAAEVLGAATVTAATRFFALPPPPSTYHTNSALLQTTTLLSPWIPISFDPGGEVSHFHLILTITRNGFMLSFRLRVRMWNVQARESMQPADRMKNIKSYVARRSELKIRLMLKSTLDPG